MKHPVSLHTDWPGRHGDHEAEITKVNGRPDMEGGVDFGVAPASETLLYLAIWEHDRVEMIIPLHARWVVDGEVVILPRVKRLWETEEKG